MENFTNRLYLSLENELDRIRDQEENMLIQLKMAIAKTHKALKILRSFIIRYTFNSVEEEVKFFKSVKTLFFSKHIFHVYRYTIESGMPASNDELLKDYYINELNYLQKFLDQHAYEHQYYRLKETDLDEHYFTRQKSNSILPANEQVPDPLFSTSHDYLFSKIRAFKLLQDHICFAINKLNRKLEPLSDPSLNQKAPFMWTGEQVNLVELIYGIYYTGQLNHGNVEVKDIIELMETIFQVKLKSPYHTFGNIRRRKSISPTAYLDKMKDAILQRIEEDLAYQPNRGIMLRNKPGE